MPNPQDILNQYLDATNEQAKVQFKKQIEMLDGNKAENAAVKFKLAAKILEGAEETGEALKLLEPVAKSKLYTEEAEEARIMYAICLWGVGKQQLAVFELRKILSGSPEPSIHTSLALDYLTLYMGELNSSDKEMATLNEKRIDILSHLSHTTENTADKAAYALRLASAFASRNEGDDLEHAKNLYKGIIAEENKVDELTVLAAKEGLKGLK